MCAGKYCAQVSSYPCNTEHRNKAALELTHPSTLNGYLMSTSLLNTESRFDSEDRMEFKVEITNGGEVSKG